MIVTVRAVSLLPSTRAVLINLVRPSILDFLKVFSDVRTTTTLDTLSDFLASVPPFKPCPMQETLCPERNTISESNISGDMKHVRNTSESSARQ